MSEFTLNLPGFSSEEEMPSEGDSEEELAQEQESDADRLQRELDAKDAEIADLKAKSERDISNIRSSLDQRYARETKELRDKVREQEDRTHQAAMANMDEQEAKAYQLQVEQERRIRAEEALAKSDADMNAVRAMNQYAQGFMELGVEYSDLDFSSPDALYTSGWEGVMKSRQGLLERIEALEAKSEDPKTPQETPTTPVTPTPEAPPVMTQHGEQPSATRSIGDVVTALKAQRPDVDWNEDLVVTYVERGLLPKSVIDGIDWTKL